MEINDIRDSAMSVGESILDGAGSLLNNVNDGRLWLGRQVNSITQAVHPKTLFFPSKTVQKLFDFIGHQFHTSLFTQGAAGFGQSMPYVQSLFALTGVNGLLNLKLRDFDPMHKAKKHHHKHHEVGSVLRSHLENIGSLRFVKSFASLFDYSAGIVNCGLGTILQRAGLIGVVTRGAMHSLNQTLTAPRNILSFVFHAGVAAKDFSALYTTYQTEGDLNTVDIKELVWKNGVPLARYGALLLPALGLCAAPAAAAFAGFVSFGMASIQIFSNDFKNEDVGGGCC